MADTSGGEQWMMYERLIDDKPHLALIREDWAQRGPLGRRPICVVVKISYPSHNEHGVPTPERLRALRLIENEAGARLERDGAVAVATLTGGGIRALYFYAPKRVDEATLTRGLAQGELGVTVTQRDDSAWQLVRDEAWPTREEMRWTWDTMVLRQLEEAGDDMQSERPIEHYAMFASKSAGDQFVQWLRSEGFESKKGAIKSDGTWLVVFSKPSHPDIEEIYEQTQMIAEAAEALGGEYDGWECRVVKG